MEDSVVKKFVSGRDATFYAKVFINLTEEEKRQFFNSTTAAEKIKLMNIPTKQRAKFNRPTFDLQQLIDYATTKANRKEIHRQEREKEFREKILPKWEKEQKIKRALNYEYE